MMLMIKMMMMMMRWRRIVGGRPSLGQSVPVRRILSDATSDFSGAPRWRGRGLLHSTWPKGKLKMISACLRLGGDKTKCTKVGLEKMGSG